MKIQVTEKHIKRGKRKCAWRCPVALALQDVLDGPFLVGKDCIYAGRNPYACPKSVSRFVMRFDSGKLVKPFTFVLKEKE